MRHKLHPGKVSQAIRSPMTKANLCKFCSLLTASYFLFCEMNHLFKKFTQARGSECWLGNLSDLITKKHE